MRTNLRKQAAGLALGLLAGCAGMGPAIEGWPQLTVYEHHVPHAEMRERCARYSAFGSPPLSCAEVSFAERRCDIWFSADFPPSAYVQRHERLHCAGHDHEGDDTLRSALAGHRRAAAVLARLQN